MGLAFFLRFYRYDYFPPHDGFYAIEEPQSGMGAWDIIARDARPWEFLLDRWLGVPGLRIFGSDDITVLRVPFSIVSALTIPAMYLLARQLVSPPAALVGASLLMMSRWHLNYARNAHNIFPTTFLVVVILVLCVRAYRRGGLRLYPWIGFWSGYTMYAYAGYRGTSVLVAVFLCVSLIHAWLDWRNAVPSRAAFARRRLLTTLAGAGIAAVALVIPLGVLVGQLRENPAYFLEAANRSYMNKEYYTDDWSSWVRLRLLRQVDTAMIFNHKGDTEQAYNLPNEPMLDPVSGVLFPVAIFYCVLWWRRRLHGYFAWAFLFLLIVGATITQTLVVCRLQGVVPLLFLLIAFLADRVFEVFEPWLRRAAIPVLGAATLALLGAAFYFNFEAFFGRTINDPVVRAVFRNFYTAGIDYYHKLPGNGYFMFVSDMHNFFEPNDYSWWRGHRVPGAVTNDLWPLLKGEPGPWRGRETHVVIQRPFEQSDLIRLVKDYYPDAECNVLRHPEPLPHLDQAVCILRGAQPARLPEGGVHARYFRGDETTPFLERDEPAISWALVPDACEVWNTRNAYTCRVEWAGSVTVPPGPGLDLQVDGRDVEFEASVDGRPFQGLVQLPAGRHDLKLAVKYKDSVGIGTRLQWRSQNSPEWQLLRFDTTLG